MLRDVRFDVVVVGGGTAGCVLAARLSETPDRTVCLRHIPWAAAVSWRRLLRPNIGMAGAMWLSRAMQRTAGRGRRNEGKQPNYAGFSDKVGLDLLDCPWIRAG